jgi:tetratricopeptide (TPR) repeat protein
MFASYNPSARPSPVSIGNKTVFGNSMVAHVWAAGKEHGRSNNGQFYFDGARLFSYGAHYVVGYRYTGPDGAVTFLINGEKNSVTTGRHVSYARSAAFGRVIMVPDLTALVRSSGVPFVARDVARYMEANAAGLSDEAATFLFEVTGAPNPARALVAFRAKAERAAKAAKEAEAKQERDAALHLVKQVLSQSPADRAAFLAETVARNRWSIERFRDNVKAVRKAIRLLPARNVRMIADAKAWLKAETARIDHVESRASVLERNAPLKVAIREYRAALALIRAGGIATDSAGPFAAIGRAVDAIAFQYQRRRAGRATPGRPMPADMALALRVTGDAANVDMEAARARQRTFELARRERERALREAGQAATRAAWFAGDPAARWSGRDEQGRAYVRAVDVERDATGAIVGGTLETSQGAEVPLPHAIRAFRFLKAVRARGTAWTRNGRTIRVGHFQVDRIDSDGSFVAGCHAFAWGEVERLARDLGLVDICPLPLDAADSSH